MPITISWDNDRHTMQVYEFSQVWTWDEFYAAKREADGILDGITHPVAVVFSGPPDVRIPEGFIAQVVNITRTRHKRAYLAVVVTSNMLVRTLLNTASKLYGREFRTVAFVPDLAAARVLVEEREAAAAAAAAPQPESSPKP
jgi:hypothetical protein